MAEPKIRAVESRDADAIRRLVSAVLVEYGLVPDPGGTDADLADPVGSYTSIGGHFWVVEDAEGVVVGTCGLHPIEEGVVELRKMYLAPALRGRGWGRRLLEHALDAARADGCVRVELETASVLTEAIALYKKYGFERRATAPEVPRCDQSWTLDLQ